MSRIISTISRIVTSQLIVFSLAMALPGCLASLVSAGTFDADFKVAISAKERILMYPNDPNVQHSEMWDTAAERIMGRNMPFVELTNTSTSSDVVITKFRMTIGDTKFNFADNYFTQFTVLGDSNTTTVAAKTSHDTVDQGDNTNEIVLSFGSEGLKAGETVRFRLDINADSSLSGVYSHPDYRTVFFDMGGIEQYGDTPMGSADNSEFFVSFREDSTSMTSIATSQLDDSGPAPVYFNEHLRPYGVMEDVIIIGQNGSVVPEPGSIALVGLSLLGLLGSRRSRRNRA